MGMAWHECNEAGAASPETSWNKLRWEDLERINNLENKIRDQSEVWKGQRKVKLDPYWASMPPIFRVDKSKIYSSYIHPTVFSLFFSMNIPWILVLKLLNNMFSCNQNPQKSARNDGVAALPSMASCQIPGPVIYFGIGQQTSLNREIFQQIMREKELY